MTSFSALLRGALLGAALFGACAPAFATDPPKSEHSVDMAALLKPGPLPELSLGDPKGVSVVEYGSLTNIRATRSTSPPSCSRAASATTRRWR